MSPTVRVRGQRACIWTDAGPEGRTDRLWCIAWDVSATQAANIARTLQGEGFTAEIRHAERSPRPATNRWDAAG